MPGITYISIKPEGFVINGNLEKSITFKIKNEKWARKLWSVASGRRFLVCFSSNGINARDGKDCSKCFDRDACLLKKDFSLKWIRYCFAWNFPVHRIKITWITSTN